jgi:hypothetical protein
VPSFIAASNIDPNENRGDSKGMGSNENNSSIQPDVNSNVDGKGRRMMMLFMMNTM